MQRSWNFFRLPAHRVSRRRTRLWLSGAIWDGGGTGLAVPRWLTMTSASQLIRQSLSTRRASPLFIAAAAFAVGLVIGCCIFLIPFAVSSRGESGTKLLAATTDTPTKTENPTITEAAVAQPAASQDGATTCDRQAWPYVTQECRQKMSSASGGKDRQVRVVTTDGNTPAMIATPAPVIPPPAQPVQQATLSPSPQSQPSVQGAPAATSEQSPPLQVSPVVAAADTAENKPAPVANERKARSSRATREARSGRMMVRVIEFADGRTVTITHPIGKGGTAAAAAALDRASEDARTRQEPGNRRYVAESDEDRDMVDMRRRAPQSENRRNRQRAWYEPDPEPAMAQADDDDLAASSRTTRRRYR